MNMLVFIHCREEGCLGKYIPRGPRDFPRSSGAKSLPKGNILEVPNLFMIFSSGIVSRNSFPLVVFPNTLPWEQGVYWKT